MADFVREEITKLFTDKVIDNRKVTMVDALSELLPEARALDMAVGYFYVSGFEFVRDAYESLMNKPEAKIRILMGNQTNEYTRDVLSSGKTPEEAALEDISDFDENQAGILHQVARWMREGRLEVKVYTGEANYFHAKSYLFREDQHGLRGSAIVGSSNFSHAGLVGNTELNTFSQDNYIALRKWFDSIWESDEVKNFSPELIKAAHNQLPLIAPRSEAYLPGLATYLEFARRYARPPLYIGSDGFWESLYPHQKSGVAECVNRIRQYGTALLCDGVGLGKTRTAAGVIRELGSPKTLILAATKLQKQWRSELSEVGVDKQDFDFLSKEMLARMSASELRELASYELFVIDEAHQGFRNSGRKTYRNLQYILGHAGKQISGLLLTATPWNNSRSDVFHLGRLFLRKENVPQSKPYADYLLYASRKAGKAFESDDKAFAAFWEDLFLQRTRKTYGGQDVTFAMRNFPAVEIVYEPKKQQALEDNFERISKLRLPYMDPLRYLDGQGDEFASDRLKLLFLKRADSSWVAFISTLESIYEKLVTLIEELSFISAEDAETKRRFQQWITGSYGINENFSDFSIPSVSEDKEDLTEFEWISRENRARYVRKMMERIEAIDKRQAKKTLKLLMQDTQEDMRVLNLIREDLSDAFKRKDEKYEAVRDEIIKAAKDGEKILVVSQFRDTTTDYFNRLSQEPQLSNFRIAHVSGSPNDCFVGSTHESLTKEEILDRFAPVAKNAPQFSGSSEEVNIVIGTDTLSIGQNLQDSRVLMNLDLPYNPMILEQRIGRIDRPREDGQVRTIDIYSFPSVPVIEAELKMTERLRAKLEGIFNDTRFDDLVLPEYEEFLKRVLKDRGKAVEKMLDETVERSIVQVNAISHSAEYLKAQERMWSVLQQHKKVLPDKTALPNVSVGKQENSKTVAVVKTILRDINNQEIESVRTPLLLCNLEADIVKVEDIWHKAITASVGNTLEVSRDKALNAYKHAEKRLYEWTIDHVEQFNSHSESSKSIKNRLVESRAKEVASNILSSTKGPNRIFIAERIKSLGYSPKMLKQLSSAIEYIDMRDSEFGDVLDLYADLNRLWNDFGYYVERFIGENAVDEQVEETAVPKRIIGRLANVDKSETVLEIGHIAVGSNIAYK